MKKYRIKPYDLVHDIWYIQRRFLWIFWLSVGVGSKHEAQYIIDELNEK